jgi:phosphoenolpyruvate synthase/pyruvate phosphate dikinase
MQLKWVTSRKIEWLIWIPPLKMILCLNKLNSSDALIDKDYTEDFIHWCATILLNNINIAKDLLKRTRKICSEIKELWNNYKNKVRDLTEDELVWLIKKIEKLEMNALLIWTPFAFADVLWDITNTIKDIVYSKKSLSKDPSEYINILSSPKELSDTKLAYKEIGKLWNDKSKKDYLLDKYYRLDQWYIGKWLTEEELNLLIEKNSNNQDNNKVTYDSLYKEINLSPKEERYFELSRIIIEWKSLRWDARQFCFVVANKIVERLSKERWVSEEVLNCMTCDELIEYIKHDALPKWASERLKWAIVTITYDKKQKIKILTWSKRLEFEEKYIYHDEIKKSDTLNGQVAFHWKYTGKVKLIFSPKDNDKVDPWDILVASTTTPQLLPAMVKAWAFITEIWWITSHAAIIAREMKKPCIVWVSHVMQLLKDNMYVELDTDNWTINIIKNK